MMTRDEIRASARKLREEASKIQAAEMSTRIAERIVTMDEYMKAERVLCYVALRDEVQTSGLLHEIQRSGRTLYLPRTKGSQLDVVRVTPETRMISGAFGVLEPEDGELAAIEEMDLVLAPGVAFDRAGNRLGYGKGYFDRLLASCRCPVIGLAYEVQIFDQIPTREGDVPIDKVVTEKNVYVRGEAAQDDR